MASIVPLAAWAAALEPRTARDVDRFGQVVDVGTPGPVEDTNPVNESHKALEGSHEAENLAARGQNADSEGAASIGESTVAVETSVDLADEMIVAESAAAVDFAGSAGEAERDVVGAAVGSELVASMKECRSGERSTRKA